MNRDDGTTERHHDEFWRERRDMARETANDTPDEENELYHSSEFIPIHELDNDYYTKELRRTVGY